MAPLRPLFCISQDETVFDGLPFLQSGTHEKLMQYITQLLKNTRLKTGHHFKTISEIKQHVKFYSISK